MWNAMPNLQLHKVFQKLLGFFFVIYLWNCFTYHSSDYRFWFNKEDVTGTPTVMFVACVLPELFKEKARCGMFQGPISRWPPLGKLVIIAPHQKKNNWGILSSHVYQQYIKNKNLPNLWWSGRKFCCHWLIWDATIHYRTFLTTFWPIRMEWNAVGYLENVTEHLTSNHQALWKVTWPGSVHWAREDCLVWVQTSHLYSQTCPFKRAQWRETKS